MFNKTYIVHLAKRIERQLSTKIKQSVKPDETVLDAIRNELYKPRRHPGTALVKTVTLPENIIEAIGHVTEDYPVKSILADSAVLNRHLIRRLVPIEAEQFKMTKQKVYEEVLSKEGDVEIGNAYDERQFKQRVKDKVDNILRNRIYHWTPMEYNAYNSLTYLFGRTPMEYASLIKIFSEINARDADFKPKSVFDFGSGVGSVIWAVNMYWKKHIFEYYNVDSSSVMNDLSQLLLQGGRGTKKIELKGVFYRQFLPANNLTYDLVVSAYSLLELPNFRSRMETIVNLWNKTEKYLVIVENGTNAGFRVVNEARDFILQIDDDNNRGRVLSPCPHDRVCPRFTVQDNTPCNFEVAFTTLQIGAKSEVRRELYSYVVLTKGKMNESNREWPRIVRETLVKSGHTICRVCTAQGDLREVIFTASKHGKYVYQQDLNLQPETIGLMQ